MFLLIEFFEEKIAFKKKKDPTAGTKTPVLYYFTVTKLVTIYILIVFH